MPIYEYEPTEHECLMCPGRVAAIQGVDEPPLSYCPDCGLPVKRVISTASFKVSKASSLDKAGQRGFTTFKKSQTGVWEKQSGEGPDVIVGHPDDVKAIQDEKKPAKTLDLDS